MTSSASCTSAGEVHRHLTRSNQKNLQIRNTRQLGIHAQQRYRLLRPETIHVKHQAMGCLLRAVICFGRSPADVFLADKEGKERRFDNPLPGDVLAVRLAE